jgi:hypothetical protein
MNYVLDGWNSPWRTFHKILAGSASHTDGKQDQTIDASSWLGKARTAAETTRVRRDQATDH